ncbi:MAG TPA: hypothetical protein VM122_07005 [Usitatibacter sp.]|nr:hypothetical protein [Usitatibacter sp.]
MMRTLLLLLACAGVLPAQAYCVQNLLPDRSVRVEQESHPDKLRDERAFRHTLKPGERRCCEFHKLDCNPGGRQNSVVNLAITVPGQPAYSCGFPEGAEPNVKVTGAGTLRIMPNPRTSSSYPIVVRVRTHDRKDLTGPRGLVCPEIPSKGKK